MRDIQDLFDSLHGIDESDCVTLLIPAFSPGIRVRQITEDNGDTVGVMITAHKVKWTELMLTLKIEMENNNA